MRQVLPTGLEVEMAEHQGYARHQRAGLSSKNARNGSYRKRVATDIGDFAAAHRIMRLRHAGWTLRGRFPR
jgi:transposase-like protein